MGQGAKVEIVGVETVRALTLGSLYLGLAQTGFDRANDAQGNLVLHRENVVERAIVALGPDMPAAPRLDQLCRQTDAVASLAQAAFEDIAHAELAADLLHVDGAAFEGKGRVAGE